MDLLRGGESGVSGLTNERTTLQSQANLRLPLGHHHESLHGEVVGV